MSALGGERDRLIMNTVPRYAMPLDRALMLTASATMFEVSLGGVPTPASITFSALMLGAVGEITFSSEPAVPLAVANGNAVLRYADMNASVVTVTATTVIEDITYLARQTVAKQQALDLTPPPAPTGLVATGTPASIVLRWDAAPANYSNLSHTEVWRASVNDFAQAALVGRADGREYTDPVGPGATRYYWIRYVSRAAIPGPYNAGSGTVGASDIEVEHLLDVLKGEITESQLHADLGQKIGLIDDLADMYGDTVSAAASAAAAQLAAAAADRAAGGASQYASQANQSATNASTAASAASTAAGQSSQSATSASGSAADAASSASTAATAAGAAGASASAASNSKDQASAARDAAGVQAAASSQSAIEAKAARDTASGAASAALQSAGTASAASGAAGNSATAANAARVAAEAAYGQAAGAAQAASGSAQAADARATAAGQSAAAANNSATTAGTAAGQAGSYLQQVAQSAANADGSAQAAASYLQQAQATLNDPITGLVASYAAVSQQATATANSLGQVRAKYAVRVDAGGVAGGFELIGGGGAIDFGVRATTFYIASPAGSGIPSAVPFIVRTTETVIGGVTVPIGMYVADAFIQNASIVNAKIGGDIWSSNFVAGQAGWRLYRSGDMEINNLRARGAVMGGAFTSYAWPEDGGQGFYLSQLGLLMGNPRNGRYLQIGSEGNIYMPGLEIVNGGATFTGSLSAATGSFAGNVTTGSAPGFRVEMGPSDPVYAMWAGSGAKTDANAIFFLKRNGAGYFGGALTGGVLRTSVTNPTVDPAAQVVDGPFGSNGGTITVVGSIDWQSRRSSLNHFFTAGAGATQAVLQLYRKIGTSAETLVHSATVPGSLSISNRDPSDEASTADWATSGSFTFTDPVTSTLERTYRLIVAITSRAVSTAIKPGAGGTGFQPASATQRLTVITSE